MKRTAQWAYLTFKILCEWGIERRRFIAQLFYSLIAQYHAGKKMM
jgi:hypothetical protein